MPLLPILPVIPGESLTSYFNRMAHFHGRTGVYQFLDIIELSRGAVMTPKEPDFARIRALTGLSDVTLSRMTFCPLGGRMRSIAGEAVHAEFAYLDKTSYCPACLLEDGKLDSASAGIRVGRIEWQIESVRTCGRHGICLTRRKNADYGERFQLMSAVAPDDQTLKTMVAEAERITPSGLQNYILARLSGEIGPAWLDGQPIDLAARACEMLGVILAVGSHIDLRAVTEEQWREAGDVGFRFAATGEDGVREGLQLALSRVIAKGSAGGPQMAFGRLYQWLQFNSNDKPFGPIREVVREFILDNFPIQPGVDLLGTPVDHRRVHSVQSLAKATGDHPKTINRAVILAGLASGDPDQSNPGMVFDAADGEDLMSRIRNSIPALDLQEYLNCNRVQAEQLVRTGTIPRLMPNSLKASGVLKKVALADADAFLNRLMGAATKVQVPSDGMMNIVDAAEASRWPVIDIINGILSDMFSKVELCEPALKFKAVLVDPREVREILSRAKSEGGVGFDEAARILGMPIPGLNALSRMRRPNGTAYVEERSIPNAKGIGIRVFSLDDLHAFLKEHISLKEYAEEQGVAPKWMKVRLDAKGIEPISPKYELGRVWYRREDLAA